MVEEDWSNMQTLNRKALNDDKMFLIKYRMSKSGWKTQVHCPNSTFGQCS